MNAAFDGVWNSGMMAGCEHIDASVWDTYRFPGFRPTPTVQGIFSDPKARVIKGQKYTRLSHRENLKPDGRRSLRVLLKANRRLNTAYLLKEEFGQLWDYEWKGWARRFFENWRAALKWPRLKPYEKFAEMIDRHGDGIAAYCKPENKVALGFVEGMNNKIRVMQRRSDGLRDEGYLRLKVLTGMLAPI